MRKLLMSMMTFMAMLTVSPVFAQEASKPDLAGVESISKMIFNFLASNFPVASIVFGSLAGLIVMGRAYVAMTPSKKDDEMLQKLEQRPYVGMLFRVLAAFSPIQRKDKK